ncbi:SCO family protein, partial [Candidatus Magnetaquicoccus inordinatus]|uniref:SCO family protein n=1 Tax=Candidatus Magnetaquicoccus inordinatus TaxID=2496818 RepID=UPI00102C0979
QVAKNKGPDSVQQEQARFLTQPRRIAPLLFALWICPLFFLLFCQPVAQAEESTVPDPEQLLRLSQAAIGKTLPDLAFVNQRNEPVSLGQLRGKPLLINLIYTTCYHTCSIATRSLATTVAKAKTIFGEDAFEVLTVGFDTHADTPKAMDYYARQQKVSDPRWQFLSGTAESVQQLMEHIGFVAYPSPRGYDHLAQVTVVDQEGKVYQQAYGETIPTPQLIEPLKELILGLPQKKEETAVDLLVRRVRFFCTTYDPRDDTYRYDYSLFVGIFIGALCILAVVIFLVREIRRNKTFSKK